MKAVRNSLHRPRGLLHAVCAKDWRIWLALVGVTLLAGVLLQTIVLPHLVPSLHAGDGLLVGGDWIGFHREAAALADRVRDVGWSAWELRPDDQSLVGLTAAIYALTTPEPWVLLPIQAILHATAAVALVWILQGLGYVRRRAVVAGLAYAFMPVSYTHLTLPTN